MMKLYDFFIFAFITFCAIFSMPVVYFFILIHNAVPLRLFNIKKDKYNHTIPLFNFVVVVNLFLLIILLLSHSTPSTASLGQRDLLPWSAHETART